jgi:ribosomal protein S18 acetylase RimI-like enzyme
MPSLDVRSVTEADLAAVSELLVAQLREHRVDTPAERIASAAAAVVAHPERGRLLVAVEDGRAVGVAAISFMWPIEHGGKAAWLEELYIVPAARERGVGTRLLREALRVARECGAVAVDLEVDVEHERVASLYAREGFEKLPRARWVRRLV